MSTITGYIDKVASFNGGRLNGVTIESGQITARILELAVPGAGSAAQQGVLKSAAKYASSVGVELKVEQVH